MTVSRAGETRGAGELLRADGTGQSKEVGRVCSGGLVVALFEGVVVAELAENDGAHGGSLGGPTVFPVEAETLTADGALNVLSELRSPE
jgi:hypothetical protein